MTFQLVPPHFHRTNLAECAIQTCKAHFKAGLASVDQEFSLTEWDRLLPHAVITLNLLRSARVNPNLSAYAYFFGQFVYNKTFLAPPGTKVVAHNTPEKRATWALNGEMGWTVGPAPDHYRCITCYFPRTRTERQCDTITYFPTIIPFPKVGLEEFLRQAATDIVTILSNPPSTTVPGLEQGSTTNNALLKLAKILNRVEHLPEVEKSLHPPEQTTQQYIAPVPRVQTPTNPQNETESAPTPRVVEKVINPQHHPQQQLHDKISPPTWQRNTTFKQTRYNLRSTGTNFRSQAAQYLVAQHIFQSTQVMHHIYNDSGKKETLASLLSGENKNRWAQALSNEWGRVANGNTFGIKGTQTLEFVAKNMVPNGKAVTYGSFVCDHRPLKTEQWRVRLVVGGDKLPYDNDSGSPAANLLDTKIEKIVLFLKHHREPGL